MDDLCGDVESPCTKSSTSRSRYSILPPQLHEQCCEEHQTSHNTMADVHLRPEDLKALDQARQKLSQIEGNIGSVKNDMLQNNPLPQWSVESLFETLLVKYRPLNSILTLFSRRESLQASAAILNRLVSDMSKHLAQHADLFQRVAVHPSTNFPGRTQEPVLHNLLRKKLDIPVEDMVKEGREIQAENEKDNEKENDELWTWTREWVGERVAMHVISTQGQYYTAEEKEKGIESVRTGLRRKFEEEEGSEEASDDDEEDEDEDMDDVGLENTTVTATKDGQVQFGMEEVKKGQNPGGNSRRLSDIMRYITTGDSVRHYPSDRELDIAANKSMEFSPLQGFQKSRRP